MIRWKYIGISACSDTLTESSWELFLRKINERSMEGWELVSFVARDWRYEGVMKKLSHE
jgi:hypothetical protein